MFLLLISSFLSEFIYKLSTSERFWIFGLGSLNFTAITLLVLFICSTFFLLFFWWIFRESDSETTNNTYQTKNFLLEEREKRERES
jgi:hypothetical protein